jgi:NADH-quinone oxidoreductase subunit J
VHVVALFQVLIYVGAVMVFMVYAIMLLDDRDASLAHMFSRWSVPAVIVVVVPVVALGAMLVQWAPLAAPAATPGGPGPFSFSAFSIAFMAQYWFHFEVASILLVIGIVAAWAVIAERR